MVLEALNLNFSTFVALAHNVPTLGEGGDFNHKCKSGERMSNIAVIVERSTAPPLLPNVCYMPPFLWFKNIF